MTNSMITNKKTQKMYAGKMDLRIYSAKNLAHVRKEKGFSQVSLSNDSGVSAAMIAKLEQGTTNPTSELLSKIGKTLGVYWVIAWGEKKDSLDIFYGPEDNSF